MIGRIEKDTDKAQILIVDDSSASLKLMTTLLTNQGYQVRPASSGPLALRSVAIETPDLILLDVKMPDMDGYEVCRRLKADPQTFNIPLIFITGLDDVVDKVKGFAAGGVDCITKPFDSEDLLARIETHLQLRRLQRQLEERNLQLQKEIGKRERAERLLQDKEACYRAIVEAFDGYIYICSRDYRVEFMNERFIERTGYDGTGELCFEALHNRDAICPWCVNNRVFNGETVRWEVLSPKDNRWFYVVNVPIVHADGSISKQAMILDITDRKRMEEELRQAHDHLERQVTERTAELAQANASLRVEAAERKRAE
jgi:CheY-like chemotaxis protein